MARSFRRLATLVGIASFVCILSCSQEIPDAPQPKIQPPANSPFSDTANHPTQAATSAIAAPAVKADEPTPQPNAIATSRTDLFNLSANVTFVEVPVTVETASGHLYKGLAPNDFTVYEDGVLRPLSLFNSEPFPLSVGIVVDTHLPASTLKKVNETLPALFGAFSEFDEVALYRYGDSVEQVQPFTAPGSLITASWQPLKRTSNEDEVPVLSGPFAVSPSVNHHPIEPQRRDEDERWGGHQSYIPTAKESNVLNDALLQAAKDLSRRKKAGRRRVIFVIGDGRESHSTAQYNEVREFLLTHDIVVYGLGVELAAIPIHDKPNWVREPGPGYGNILSRYASDTGGNTVMTECDQKSIERAYQEIMNEARNQYTLGYYTQATPSYAYHSIDVHVRFSELMVRAKNGYYSSSPNPQTH